ncbi:hypothetical protein ETD86_34130 [Nonomuraea turkmeniaca]|uniref:Lactococcin 972 family bacteriocin n=1 Tax=Nonomuraea turkmeniaca TaxID=103838 RepID=A0A5S4F6X8_9ACTN|nr:hypothetical protein [Nonomuraea turkmeniaca]TMR11984.1 hypothetical protein ETD86_34130 [Nonomuraea turkmeniaca]
MASGWRALSRHRRMSVAALAGLAIFTATGAVSGAAHADSQYKSSAGAVSVAAHADRWYKAKGRFKTKSSCLANGKTYYNTYKCVRAIPIIPKGYWLYYKREPL